MKGSETNQVEDEYGWLDMEGIQLKRILTLITSDIEWGNSNEVVTRGQ